MLTVYGIPTCATVRRARAWLDARGVPHRFVDLREHPPDRARIARWIDAFGSKALRNTSGRSYRALGDEKRGWSDAEWAARMARDPMLLKRPIIEGPDGPLLVGFRGSDEALADRLGLRP